MNTTHDAPNPSPSDNPRADSPALVEVTVQTIREQWRRFSEAVTANQHAVVSFSPARITNDPNRKPYAVAVTHAWWEARLGKRRVESDSIAVNKFRSDLRRSMRRVHTDHVHLHVTWWGEPSIVLMPPEHYVRWAKTHTTAQLVKSATPLP